MRFPQAMEAQTGLTGNLEHKALAALTLEQARQQVSETLLTREYLIPERRHIQSSTNQQVSQGHTVADRTDRISRALRLVPALTVRAARSITINPEVGLTAPGPRRAHSELRKDLKRDPAHPGSFLEHKVMYSVPSSHRDHQPDIRGLPSRVTVVELPVPPRGRALGVALGLARVRRVLTLDFPHPTPDLERPSLRSDTEAHRVFPAALTVQQDRGSPALTSRVAVRLQAPMRSRRLSARIVLKVRRKEHRLLLQHLSTREARVIPALKAPLEVADPFMGHHTP